MSYEKTSVAPLELLFQLREKGGGGGARERETEERERGSHQLRRYHCIFQEGEREREREREGGREGERENVSEGDDVVTSRYDDGDRAHTLCIDGLQHGAVN